MSARTLLIFGATGYTGRALVAQACAAGHQVFAHIRPDSPSGERYGPSFEAAGATLTRCAWTPQATRATALELRPDLVFALLGTTKKKAAAAGSGAGYAEVDVGMSNMAIDAFAALARVQRELAPNSSPGRFVYLSAFGVREGTRNGYLAARAEVEAHLREQAAAAAFEYLIARPSFITGPDRHESRPGERVGAAIANGLLGGLGLLGMAQTKARYASIDAATLAAALLALSTSNSGRNSIVDSADLKAAARGDLGRNGP